jgi:hypothetical protein
VRDQLRAKRLIQLGDHPADAIEAFSDERCATTVSEHLHMNCGER